MISYLLHNNILYKHGDKIDFTIDNNKLEGSISIISGKLWACHNEYAYNGDESPDRLGINIHGHLICMR